MKTRIVLIGCGAASLALFAVGTFGHGWLDFVWFVPLTLVQGGLFAVASIAAFRAPDRRSTLLIVIGFGLVFRAVALVSPPFASSDIYRYVWDGRVTAAGINPYAYLPSDPRLAGLRDPVVYPNINRRSTAPTIYPPVAEGAFFLATRFGGVYAMKAAMTVFDLAAMLILMRVLFMGGVPLQRIVLYAWHPLIVWEFSGNGHVDAMAVALIAAAILAYRLDRRYLVGAALAAATLVKFFPIVLLAPLYRRGDWKMPLAFAVLAVAAYLPFLSVGARVFGYLPGYVHEEGIDSGLRFYLINVMHVLHVDFPTALYLGLGAALVAALSVLAVRTDPAALWIRDAYMLGIAATVVVLLSPAYPWYFAWLVPLCVICNSRAVLYLTLAAPILYIREMFFDSTATVLVLDSIVFVPAGCLAIASFLHSRRATGRTLEAHE